MERDSLPNYCFLHEKGRKYPICDSRGQITYQAINLAYRRSVMVNANAIKHGHAGGPIARSVMKKAKELMEEMEKSGLRK